MDANKLKKKVQKLLSKHGSDVQLVLKSSPSYNKTTGKTSTVGVPTCKLVGNIDDTVASLDFDTLTNGPLAPYGVALIGTEQIRYSSVTMTDDVSGTLAGLTRGHFGTTAAAHNDNDAIGFNAGIVTMKAVIKRTKTAPDASGRVLEQTCVVFSSDAPVPLFTEIIIDGITYANVKAKVPAMYKGVNLVNKEFEVSP
jgi:hypothetical protein